VVNNRTSVNGNLYSNECHNKHDIPLLKIGRRRDFNDDDDDDDDDDDVKVKLSLCF